MKITAISDLHGNFPEISDTDLLIIAGDFSPINIQQNTRLMEEWIKEELVPYFKRVVAKKIVFIAGDHDFVCLGKEIDFVNFKYEYDFKLDFLNPLLRENGLDEKVYYLKNELLIFNDIRIYGCPYVKDFNVCAFCNAEELDVYSKIKKCDILIMHQPPLYRGFDETYIINEGNKRSFVTKDYDSDLKIKMNFGSEDLLKRIKFLKPKYVFCGHIHEGNHSEVNLVGTKTIMYNVSLLNENYELQYKPLELEY